MVKLNLSILLGARKMNQAELSRLTGIRPNTIHDLYHDLAERVNLEHLDRICEVLHCSLDELIQRIPNQTLKTDNKPICKTHKNKKLKM